MPYNKTKKKYPGRLGKPTRKNAIVGLLFQRGSKAMTEHEADTLNALCDHYGIDAADTDRWFFLALDLAREHVPAMQITSAKGAGAPRKKRRFLQTEKRKVGAPKRVPDEQHTNLLLWVNETIRREQLSGRGAIKKALVIALRDIARTESKSPAWAMDNLVRWQQRYRYAAKQFPELAYKTSGNK